VLQFKH